MSVKLNRFVESPRSEGDEPWSELPSPHGLLINEEEVELAANFFRGDVKGPITAKKFESQMRSMVKGLHVSHADLKILFGSEKDITMEKLLDLLRSNKLPDDFDPAISAYNSWISNEQKSMTWGDMKQIVSRMTGRELNSQDIAVCLNTCGHTHARPRSAAAAATLTELVEDESLCMSQHQFTRVMSRR